MHIKLLESNPKCILMYYRDQRQYQVIIDTKLGDLVSMVPNHLTWYFGVWVIDNYLNQTTCSPCSPDSNNNNTQHNNTIIQIKCPKKIKCWLSPCLVVSRSQTTPSVPPGSGLVVSLTDQVSGCCLNKFMYVSPPDHFLEAWRVWSGYTRLPVW